MIRIFTLLSILFISFSGFCQTPVLASYYDFASWAATSLELQEMNKVENKMGDLESDLRTTLATSTAEYIARSTLGSPTYTINFLEYQTVCDIYISPGKKKLCTERLYYLETSYLAAYNLLSISTKSRLRNGVIEQIWEKYASVCNVIVKDLDRMQKIAEDDYSLSLLNYAK